MNFVCREIYSSSLPVNKLNAIIEALCIEGEVVKLEPAANLGYVIRHNNPLGYIESTTISGIPTKLRQCSHPLWWDTEYDTNGSFKLCKFSWGYKAHRNYMQSKTCCILFRRLNGSIEIQSYTTRDEPVNETGTRRKSFDTVGQLWKFVPISSEILTKVLRTINQWLWTYNEKSIAIFKTFMIENWVINVCSGHHKPHLFSILVEKLYPTDSTVLIPVRCTDVETSTCS